MLHMHYELLYCIAVKGFHTCQANRIPDRGESLRTIRGLTMRSTQHHCNTQIPSGSIVLVAKCPIAGVVKTRLANDIGDKGAASFAHAMLCDVLRQVGLSVSRFVTFDDYYCNYFFLLIFSKNICNFSFFLLVTTQTSKALPI